MKIFLDLLNAQAYDVSQGSKQTEAAMSTLAMDLFELKRLMLAAGGTLVEHLLHEVAAELIAEGVEEETGELS